MEWQYTHGLADPTLVDPDAWEHDLALLARPGNDEAQVRLFANYATNPPLYAPFQAWLRESGVPVVVVWGRNDEIFAAAGAEQFRRDAPHAPIELLDGGHFLLESHLDDVVQIILEWSNVSAPRS